MRSIPPVHFFRILANTPLNFLEELTEKRGQTEIYRGTLGVTTQHILLVACNPVLKILVGT